MEWDKQSVIPVVWFVFNGYRYSRSFRISITTDKPDGMIKEVHFIVPFTSEKEGVILKIFSVRNIYCCSAA